MRFLKIAVKRAPILTTAALLAGVLSGHSVNAGTLESLERERAVVIDTMLDPGLSPQARQARIATATLRLVDLERMVLRDESLTGRNTPTVRRAFGNYDLTFMASAASEHNLTIIDNWLSQLGLTTQNLMAADVGRRAR